MLIIHFLKILAVFLVVENPLCRAECYRRNLGDLLMGIHNRFRTSGISLTVPIGYQSLELLTFMHNTCRDLSQRLILNLIVNLTELDKRIACDEKKIGRPLVVVIIKSEDQISDFENIIRKLKMSYPLWMMFFVGKKDDKVCRFCRNPAGNGFRLRIDSEFFVSCCNTTKFEEWWSQDNHTTTVLPMGELIGRTIKWKLNDGLSVFRRRPLVIKRDIRVAILKDPNFVSFNGTHYSGFLGDLFTRFVELLQFNVLPPKKEEWFGRWDAVKSKWSGVMGRISRGEADLGLDAYTMTVARINAVDFTIPLFNKKSMLYLKKPSNTDIKWSAHAEAFRMEVWVAIMVLITGTSFLLSVMKPNLKKDTQISVLTENFLDVFGMFCQQGLTEFPFVKSLRIVYLTILLAAMVVSAVYSGSLISFLTTPSMKMPFKSMEEFAEQTDYRLIVMRDSAQYDLFASSEDPLLQKIFKLMQPYEGLPSNDDEGFQQICSKKVAFYTNEATLGALNFKIPCELLTVETGRRESLGMIMPRGSPYTKLFNYYFQLFQDNGLLAQLRNKYSSRQSVSPKKESEVELWAVVPTLVVLGGGVFLSLLILFFERIFFIVVSKLSKSSGPSCKNLQHQLSDLSRKKDRKKTSVKLCMRNSIAIMEYCP